MQLVTSRNLVPGQQQGTFVCTGLFTGCMNLSGTLRILFGVVVSITRDVRRMKSGLISIDFAFSAISLRPKNKIQLKPAYDQVDADIPAHRAAGEANSYSGPPG
jgi:hypothetical protein